MSAAAAAAAALRRRNQDEEECMTQYSAEELAQGWEFKIVRSNFASFRKPAVLQQVCEEEAGAGWTLVEKFDDQRLRFKRPITERGRAAPGIDPYRTNYGSPTGLRIAALVLIAASVSLLLMLALIVLRKH